MYPNLYPMAFVALASVDKAPAALGLPSLNGSTEAMEMSLSLQLAGEQRWVASQGWIFSLPFDFEIASLLLQRL